jgi:hypothetical protein
MRTLSYALLWVEAVILVVPTLGGLIMGMKGLAAALTGSIPFDQVPLGLILLCLLGLLVVGWYLLSQRLTNGPLALRKVSRSWWIAAGVGALLSVAGFTLMVAGSDSRFVMFSMALYGIPTLLHLTLETWVWPPGARSNTSDGRSSSPSGINNY